MELGIPYELLGPDGTRIVIGNSDAAKADPDYVGFLDPEGGIAGLDAPELRESAGDLVSRHGGIHYDFLHGRRPIVVNGVIDPNVAIATVIAREQKIKRATNAVRAAAPALLSWTNTGFPKRRLALLRQNPPRITGRRPKTFQLALVDADYRILSDAENATIVKALNASTPVVNAGDELAFPRFEVIGPTTGILRLRHTRSAVNVDVRFKSGFVLAAGEVLAADLSPPYPTVTLDGVDVYGQIDFLLTTWWGIPAGAGSTLNVVCGASAGTWQAFWRDAWI